MRRPRGTATVEMVILVIILVPIIMYYLFLQDALFFKLAAQEPVIAAPFDTITNNYNVPSDSVDGTVGGYNRLIYCDHSSSYDSSGAGGTSENRDFDCQGSPPAAGENSPTESPTHVYGGTDRGHHTEHGAHQCWISAGAHQLACLTSPDDHRVGTTILNGSGAGTDWLSAYSKGGLTTCSDRIGVLNYIIITRFFSWSARGDNVTGGAYGNELRHNRLWAHADYTQSDRYNQILMPEQKLAILTDPWALNRLAEVRPSDALATPGASMPGDATERSAEQRTGQGRFNRLSNRSGTFYLYYGGRSSNGGQPAFTTVKDFFNAAKNSFLIEDARVDGIGDAPESLPVLYTVEKTRAGERDGYASGWADSRVSGSNRPNTYPTNW